MRKNQFRITKFERRRLSIIHFKLQNRAIFFGVRLIMISDRITVRWQFNVADIVLMSFRRFSRCVDQGGDRGGVGFLDHARRSSNSTSTSRSSEPGCRGSCRSKVAFRDQGFRGALPYVVVAFCFHSAHTSLQSSDLRSIRRRSRHRSAPSLHPLGDRAAWSDALVMAVGARCRWVTPSEAALTKLVRRVLLG